MDNTEIKLAWLAGIVDGEGYIGLKVRDNRYKHPNPKRTRRGLSHSFYCMLKIETVSEAMVLAVAMIFDELHIHYSLATPTYYAKSTKPVHRIEVGRKNDMLLLCESIIPYSVVKKQELALVKSFLIKSTLVKFYRITEEDLKIITEMRNLHDINGKKGIKPKVLTNRGSLNQLMNWQGNPELSGELNS